jgi:hypothetical protein
VSNLDSEKISRKCVPLALRRWACKVQKIGRVSKGIILPKDICLAYTLKVGDFVVLEVQPRRIQISFDKSVNDFVRSSWPLRGESIKNSRFTEQG